MDNKQLRDRWPDRPGDPKRYEFLRGPSHR